MNDIVEFSGLIARIAIAVRLVSNKAQWLAGCHRLPYAVHLHFYFAIDHENVFNNPLLVRVGVVNTPRMQGDQKHFIAQLGIKTKLGLSGNRLIFMMQA